MTGATCVGRDMCWARHVLGATCVGCDNCAYYRLAPRRLASRRLAHNGQALILGIAAANAVAITFLITELRETKIFSVLLVN